MQGRLLLGLALNEHQNSLLLRRYTDDARDLAAAHGFSDMTNTGGAPVRSAPTANPAEFKQPSDSQAMAVLGKLGNAGDGLSAVLPSLRAAGTPRNWAKVPDRRA